MSEVAFLGLGVMRFPMAGHLVTTSSFTIEPLRLPRNGSKPSAERAQRLLAEASTGRDFVVAWVGNGDTFIAHSTASAIVARELDREANRSGLASIDDSVSGGQAGAQDGRLTIICARREGLRTIGAGDRSVRPILQSDGRLGRDN